jgi:3-oxoadipate enol-lactonase
LILAMNRRTIIQATYREGEGSISDKDRPRPAAGDARMVPRTVRRKASMPQVEVNGLLINYDVQGDGEPLLLMPYTSADHACYAFQLPAYIEHFSCIAIDLPGSGESDKPAGPYSTEGYADQVAAFLGAIGIEQAHVAGVSLGAAVGLHLAARHPGRVRSLSLHSGWHATDAFLRTVVEQWRALASVLPSVADVTIQGIFPWCFTPEMYVHRPEFVDTLTDFVRSRPAQPVDAFLAQIDAVMAHDASGALNEIDVPTLITFGARDVVCSTRFAEPLKSGITRSELVVFDHLSHAGLHEDPETFNRATLDFLLRQRA